MGRLAEKGHGELENVADIEDLVHLGGAKHVRTPRHSPLSLSRYLPPLSHPPQSPSRLLECILRNLDYVNRGK
jgi:hypothetical protein